MSENKTVKGYKVFNPDWTCRGFQYQVGECYEKDEKPIVCERGYHFCNKLIDCYDHYAFDSQNKVAEVIAYGEIVTKDNKSCTNKIKIEKEIAWDEVLVIVNTGKNCTGLGNIGNNNSGNYNKGSYNDGDGNDGSYNSGNDNSGNYNSGSYNKGTNNSGNDNSGNYNSGNYNKGINNSGYYNSGNYNSGNYNKGINNSGYYNSGNYNSGNYNKGINNSGNDNNGSYNSGCYNNGCYNSGNYNNGNYNSGYYNNGDYNISSYSNGCFNTKQTKMFLFNELSDWTLQDWYDSKAKRILDVYISVSPVEKTKEEILKQQQENWNQLSQEQKEIVMAIPNFDKAIFEEVTGIDVDRE